MHHNSQQGAQRQIILLHIVGAYSSIVKLSGADLLRMMFSIFGLDNSKQA